MKYFFYLLVLSLIFSLGMYIGIDRNSAEKASEPILSENGTVVEQNSDIVDREFVIEEVGESKKQQVTAAQIEPSFLHSLADGGEKAVSTICDEVVEITYTLVDGIF
ncbi:hypothetical protein [Gracilibacillus kekensis]|uniref:Uncharacterized protein n=1 Tax=Gracilibacillus kekensis TaxID=1027249 RepID=A0A1M7P368_9BACI|nr:hypothetical protein [Gracilibacillus kekensis]SHN11018.1 hypothetical protein SAMN05216179_1950 [Gracilibacillus kekensis]